jgi:hypothetical protein
MSAGDEQNGHAKSRLDRLEGPMELPIDDHLKFGEEHKLLLKAQVVLTDRVDKLALRMDQLSAAVRELTEAQKHTDDRLDALIHVVDDSIRKTDGPRLRS